MDRGADLEALYGLTVSGFLSKIPRLPDHVVRNIVDRYGGLQQILRASVEDLDTVEGIEVAGAHFVKEGWLVWPKRASWTGWAELQPAARWAKRSRLRIR